METALVTQKESLLVIIPFFVPVGAKFHNQQCAPVGREKDLTFNIISVIVSVSVAYRMASN